MKDDKKRRTCAHVDKMRNSYKSGFRIVRMKRFRCKLEDSNEMEFRKEGFECVN